MTNEGWRNQELSGGRRISGEGEGGREDERGGGVGEGCGESSRDSSRASLQQFVDNI